MEQSLIDLLHRCTAKLTVGGGHGTGFFVAPGLILTCAHVVAEAHMKSIKVRWQHQYDFAEATIERLLPDIDIALLKFNPPPDTNVPCVLLDTAVESRDPLYLFGYPDQDFPDGCPAIFTCEGLTGDEPPLIKFQLGQVRPGMSGAPLLNQRTGKVCGVVKFTRDRSTDLGGGAVPISVVLSQFGELVELQQRFHQVDRRWVESIRVPITTAHNIPSSSIKPRRIVIGIFALLVVVHAVLGNIVANVLQESLGNYWRWAVAPFVLITIILLAFELWERQQKHAESHTEDLKSRNRRAMIEKIRAIWITGVLNRSLYKEILIVLGLAERPDAVERPMDILIYRADEVDQPLPQGTRVVDVYDDLGGALLILGAPGAGKTTLLLELACDLLDRAERDTEHPIPVVFPLSTWAEHWLPLTDWLVDELSKRYDVPRKIGQAWVEDNQILPLLDGLDEVKVEHLAACVEAINTFRQCHGLLPLVICSRIVDFEAIGKRLRLQGTIVIQPLTHEQVDFYLRQGGEPLAAIRQALCDDPTLWELLDTPLMLNIVMLAFPGQPIAVMQNSDTLEERRRHVFAKYVDQMFKRRSAVTAYSQVQTVRWLAWLARTMQAHNQSVFYLEWIQPYWLSGQRQQRLVTVITSVVSGLLGGLSGGLFFGLFFGLEDGLQGGLFLGLLGALSVGIRSPLVGGLGGGLLGGLLGGLEDGLDRGLGFGLLGALSIWLVGHSKEIKPVEKIRWSWSAARLEWTRKLLKGLLGGLFFGLISVLLGGLFFVLQGGLRGMLLSGGLVGLFYGLLGGLFYGLLGGLFYGLLGGLKDGFIVGEIRTHSFPNEGIKRSVLNTLVSGLLGGLLGGLLYGGLLVGLEGWLEVWLKDRQLSGRLVGLLYRGGLVGLLYGGLLVGLRFGGRTCLHHYALRLVLWQKNFAPLNYVRFLDYAGARIFLRNVGGGYIFIHRYLLEYFASLDVDSKTEGAPKD